MKEFASHFNDEEILKLDIIPQLSYWKKELRFSENEVEFLRMTLFYNLVEKLNKDTKKSEIYLEKLKDFQDLNKFHLDTIFHFQNKLKGLRECEDVQCENFYLKDFLTLKEVLQKHFHDFREIKAGIYLYFCNGFQMS